MAEYYLLGCHKERINYPAPWSHFVQLTQISKKLKVSDLFLMLHDNFFHAVSHWLICCISKLKQNKRVVWQCWQKPIVILIEKKKSVHLLPLRQEKTVIKLILQTSVLSISYKHNGLTTGITCNWFRGHDGVKFMSFSRKGAWAYRLSWSYRIKSRKR